MAWFSKKKEISQTLPELPESTDRILFEENEIPQQEVPELPEFETSPLPDLPSSQNQIKQAINPKIDNQKMQRSKFAPIPPPREYEQMPSVKPQALIPIKTKPLQPLQSKQTRPYQEQTFSPRKTESIYVKLDKFETSLQALEEIKDKMADIEKLIAKTREIKAQEEKELEEWERELNIIKSRLDSIDKIVFKDLE